MKPLKILCILIFFIASSLLLPSCTSRDEGKDEVKEEEIVIGGLYARQNRNETYSILKVLAHDESTIHLRVYKNIFKTMPTSVDPAGLTILMTPEDRRRSPQNIGLAYYPMDKKRFESEEYVYIMKTEVTEEELIPVKRRTYKKPERPQRDSRQQKPPQRTGPPSTPGQ